MKTGIKFLVVAFSICFFFNSACAQTTATPKTTSKTSSKTSTKSKTTTKKPSPPPPGKDITITLSNADEHSVSYFAGARTDLKTPKVKIAGGLSTNTLYVKENYVVCIMDNNKKPTACTDVPPGTKTVQINSSGNGISHK